MSETIYDDPNRCVKANPELGPCTCPECLVLLKTNKAEYIPKGIVLTDKDLVSPDVISMVAWHFVCSECGSKNVGDYMQYCPNCGTRVIIRSHKVVEFLRNHISNNLGK